MPDHRSVRLAAGVAAVLATASVTAFAAPPVDDLLACPKQATVRHDGWTKIKPPPYGGDGPRVLTDLAAPDRLRGRVYATNGHVVLASTDAGCDWDRIHDRTGADGVPAATRFVVSQLVASAERGLWVTGYDTDAEAGAGVARPHVEWSPDATPGNGSGTTKVPFAPVDGGLPPLGRPLSFTVSEATVRQAFLLVAEPAPGVPGTEARKLYRLRFDLAALLLGAQEQWAAIDGPPGFGEIAGVVVAPVDPQRVIVWSGAAYAESTDGGDSWRTFATKGEVTAVDVNTLGALAVFSRGPNGTGRLRVVGDEGTHERATPTEVTAVAHGRFSGSYAISGPNGTYGSDRTKGTWLDIAPKGVGAFQRLQFGDTRSARMLLALRADAFYRFELASNDRWVPKRPGPKVRSPPPGPPRLLREMVMEPPAQVVTVVPETRADTRVTMGIPASRERLEVFFLADTTTSMTPAIRGLRSGINAIAAGVEKHTAAEACFGLGEVKDFEAAYVGPDGLGIHPYRLRQPIDCDLANLKVAVGKLKVAGGGGPTEEAQAAALEQAVKGDGRPALNIAAGQDAHFSVDSTRIIVLITDAGFQTAPEYPSHPAMDATIAALTAAHTSVVGVVVLTGNDPGPALDDVGEVVAGTGTVAPPGGVDCDGDQLVDIEGGAPLVCETAAPKGAIAPAIVQLLTHVPKLGSSRARYADPHDAVVAMSSGGVPAVGGEVTVVVDQRLVSHLPLDLSVTCSAAQEGLDLPVEITGTAPEHGSVTATVLVRCRAPVIPDPPPPPAPPPPEPPIPPPPPPKPPVVVFALPPPPPPAPANNPISNINPNAGFSHQEEEQLQLATVGQDAGEEEQHQQAPELAMSAFGRDAGAAGLVLGTSLAVSAAAGVGLARRRRTQAAFARTR